MAAPNVKTSRINAGGTSMKRRKAKKQFLKRPKRFMLRFNDAELRAFRASAKRAGLSQVEFGRRKILDIPIAEIAQPQEVEAPAEAATA